MRGSPTKCVHLRGSIRLHTLATLVCAHSLRSHGQVRASYNLRYCINQRQWPYIMSLQTRPHQVLSVCNIILIYYIIQCLNSQQVDTPMRHICANTVHFRYRNGSVWKRTARMKMTFACALWERMCQCGSSNTSRNARSERATNGSTKPQCSGTISSKEPLWGARFAWIIKTSVKATWQTTGEQCLSKLWKPPHTSNCPQRHLIIHSWYTFKLLSN